MCGIAGIISTRASAHEDVHKMCAQLVHRGPDAGGVWAAPGIAVGMRRLAIVDVVGGSQPMSTPDGRFVIVYNGEVYNHAELREQLRQLGHAFETRSDTEVVLRAFAHWGRDAFIRFDGMFALGIVDTEAREIVLARDRLGEKPLYFWRRGHEIAFASEAKAFQPLGPAPEIDRDSLSWALAVGYIPAPRTAWSKIEKLRPGTWHSISLDGDRPDQRQRYFDLPFFPRLPTSTVDPVERLQAELLSSVEKRLRADVEVGVLLSGGIDSTLLAWAASQVRAGIKTFSVSIGDEARTEAPWARSVAQSLGTDHHELTLDPLDVERRMDEMTAVYDEPFADTSALPTMMVCEFAAQRCKVVLSGDGGDELLSGYPRYRDFALRRSAGWAPYQLRQLLTHRLLGARSVTLSRIASLAALAARDPAERYLVSRAQVPPPVFELLTGRPAPYLPPNPLVSRGFICGYDFGARRSDLVEYIPDDLLTKVDRVSMAVSLEIRSPFLANSMVEWAAGLSERDLGAAGTKALGRALVERHFGADIAHRPKQGFSMPIADWLRGPLLPLLDDMDAVYEFGLVRREGFEVLRSLLLRGRPGAAGSLWAVLTVERWLRSSWQSGR